MIRDAFEDLIDFKLGKLFLIFCICSLFNQFIYSHFVWSDTIYASGSNTTEAEFSQALKGFRTIDLVRYILSPFLIAIELFLITLVVYAGFFFISYKINLQAIAKAVIIGKFISLIPEYIKTIWFMFFNIPNHRDEIDYFYPLSTMHLITDTSTLKKYLAILQKANLFEILFVVIVSYVLHLLTQKKTSQMLLLVLATYGLSMLFLLVLFVFIVQ